MKRYLFKLLPYSLGWFISRTFLGWIGLLGLVMGVMIFAGYLFEAVLLVLEFVGAEDLSKAIISGLKAVLETIGFSSFSGMFIAMGSLITAVVGFLFSFLLKYVVKISDYRLHAGVALVIFAILSLTILQFVDRFEASPFMNDLSIRIIAGGLCLLGLYLVEIAHHSLKWSLFMLHVLFLKREH